MSRVYREFAAIFGVPLAKAGGPFIGPRGGKWADAQHTVHWSAAQTQAHHHGEAVRASEERRFWEDEMRARSERILADAEQAEQDAIRANAKRNDYESTRRQRIASEAAAHEAAKVAAVDDITAIIPYDFDLDDEPIAGARAGDDALTAGVREYLGSRGLGYDADEIAARVKTRLASRTP